MQPMQKKFGVDVSDAAIRKAVAEHNRVCKLIRAIGEFRKGDKPTITGYEFSVITLATYAAPKYLIIDKLEETLEELKTRKPDPVQVLRQGQARPASIRTPETI